MINSKLVKSQLKLRWSFSHAPPIIVQEVHPSRGIGWWLILLVNYAVIGNGSNMRWS